MSIYEEIKEMRQSNEITALSDEMAIEDVMEIIKEKQHKIDQYKEQKKRKNRLITESIEKEEENIEFLKKIIRETLVQNDEKSINFPGVGKVSTRNQKQNWIIIDDIELMREIKDRECETEKYIEKTEKLLKTNVNKLLDMWEKSGQLPDCVARETKEGTVTISLE